MFPETLPVWPLDELNVGYIIADFEIYGIFGIVFFIDDHIQGVGINSGYIIHYNKEFQSFEEIEIISGFTTEFKRITGSTMRTRSRLVVSGLPTKDEINYRAVPAV